MDLGFGFFGFGTEGPLLSAELDSWSELEELEGVVTFLFPFLGGG